MLTLIVSLCLLMVGQAPAKVAKPVWNDWRDDELKGKVQKIVVETPQRNEQDGSMNERVRVKTYELTYDAQGSRLKQNYFDPQNKITTSLTYSTVNGDRVQKSVAPDHPSSPPRVSTQKRLFDEKGRVSEFQTWTDGKLYSRVLCKYDEKDNRVENIVYIGEQLNNSMKAIFDDKGNAIERTYSYFDKTTRRLLYTYEFDAQGNWTKSVQKSERMVNGKPVLEVDAIMWRTITYYR